jgi:hypothetical protein
VVIRGYTWLYVVIRGYTCPRVRNFICDTLIPSTINRASAVGKVGAKLDTGLNKQSTPYFNIH